jgi:hypothetical protein
MDATGVGAPVLDLLRRAGLRSGIEGVTGGERESHAGGVWHVPKRELITGLRVMLDNRELGLPETFGPTRALIEELRGMETRMNGGGAVRVGAWREGEQDDLVMALALALACWRARWKRREMWGTKSLGLH